MGSALNGTAGTTMWCIGLAAACVTLVTTGVAVAAPLPPPERVTFDSLDRDASGQPVRIKALLYRPAGPEPAGVSLP